jgi:raffinose/stachyose/melibiose transport system substrate-binding protein
LVEKEGSAPLTIIYSTDAFHMAFGEALQAYVGGTLSKDAACALIERRWVELEN